MTLRFCSFASGSSGNCYLVRSEEAALLVDVGISGKRILSCLEEKDLLPEQIDGILLTHEHIDHTRSLRVMGKKAARATIYGSHGTLGQAGDLLVQGQYRTVQSGTAFWIGDIEIVPFALSHDAAEPIGYVFRSGGRQLAIITDTGCVSEEMQRHMVETDLLVLEANHEVNVLKMGSYPYQLKLRILGERGHLSNETAGECLCRILQSRGERADLAGRPPAVVLAHLSKENNTPEMAYLTVRNMLFDAGFYPEKDLQLSIAARDEAGPWMEV